MSSYDFVIVGAGIVGLTVAFELRRRHKSATILVLEKEPDPGLHASGRNSGVLHAGIYYEPGSLKARLCAVGARRMREFCQAQALPFEKTGKVVVPQEPRLAPMIHELKRRADAAGVQTEVIDTKTLLEIEPAANPSVEMALHSPDTAVVDPKKVVARLAALLKDQLVQIKYSAPVTRIYPRKGEVFTDGESFSFGHLINAAGAYADKIAHLADVARHLTILPFKGTYFRAETIPVKGNIYPVPDLRFPVLGAHFTKAVTGDVYLGPSALPALGREAYTGLADSDWKDLPTYLKALGGQYLSNRQGLRHLMHREVIHLIKGAMVREAAKLVPAVRKHHLKASTKVGIRPQLYDTRSGEMLMDFRVDPGPRSTHILNAASPAFTASFAFAEYVVDSLLDPSS